MAEKQYKVRKGEDSDGNGFYQVEVKIGERSYGPLIDKGAPVIYPSEDLAKKHVKWLKLRAAADQTAVELTAALEARATEGQGAAQMEEAA